MLSVSDQLAIGNPEARNLTYSQSDLPARMEKREEEKKKCSGNLYTLCEVCHKHDATQADEPVVREVH